MISCRQISWRAKTVTNNQYSTLQRNLGILEGIGTALSGELSALFYDTIEVISDIVEELKPKPWEKGPEARKPVRDPSLRSG